MASLSMTAQTNNTFLLADIGGTHVRLAQGASSGPDLTHVQKYLRSEFSGLEELVRDYLQRHPMTGAVSACFAVAAPVSAEDAADQIVMTNCEWQFSVAQLKREFGWQDLVILNDFEAVALAVPHLPDSQLVQLGGKCVNLQGSIAVLGPGTGLGVKHLIPTADGYRVLSGEGGHVDFAPVDEQDEIIWRYIRERKSRVSLEEVLSGRGLVHIYQALAEARGVQANLTDPAGIVFAAQHDNCDLGKESLQQFCRILGSCAGNLALTLNTTGGVYLCGGVLTELGAVLADSEFRTRFESKGRFKGYVKDIPAFLITASEPGLRGALTYLQNRR